MRFRKGREEEIRLSIAPLIDIVFLLLIFFMVTSHFNLSSGVRIKLPRAAKKLVQQENRRIEILIDASGSTYLYGKKVDMETLRRRLQHLVTRKDYVNLVLQADQDTRHGTVVEAMDAAKLAGVQTIVIAAEWNP
jgi:biopolymer transport protein ExbD